MKTVRLIVSFLILFSMNSFGKVLIKQINFSKDKTTGKMTILVKGHLKEYPEMRVFDRYAYIDIPDSYIINKIQKKVSFSTNSKDTTIKAVQYDKNTTRIKIVFPFNIKKRSDLVSLTLKDNEIEMNFPRVIIKKIPVKTKPINVTAKNKYVALYTDVHDVLDENYLNRLEQEFKAVAKGAKLKQFGTKIKKDSVRTSLSAVGDKLKQSTSSFSFLNYAGKFVAFLGLVLLLFYGVITLFKKGVMKRGKLGFLNNTNQVQVLSTTHIAPKKNLMLIKAHRQVFLVSNTDAGIHLISEVNDVTGLIKDGEKSVAGNNFDDKLDEANSGDVEGKVKIKEDINVSSNSALASYMKTNDKVKFSEQLKNKVKNLKPLQFS